MRVALTGSSGMIGGALLTALRRAGHEPLALVRRAPREGEVQYDPGAGRLDPEALAGIDAAINLAGAPIATRWTGGAKREIRDSRLDTTRLLARTMASLSPRPRLLLSVSAVGIYGDRGDEVLTEESRPGQGFLPELALEWEAAASPARDAGITVIHPRFGIVLSRDGGALEKMLPPFKLGLGGRLGTGDQWMSWIDLDDLVAALLFLLERGGPEGAVNFTAPEPVTNREFTRVLGSVLSRPTIIPVPTLALQALYGEEMPRETLLASARVHPDRLVDAGFQFRYPRLRESLEHVLEG